MLCTTILLSIDNQAVAQEKPRRVTNRNVPPTPVAEEVEVVEEVEEASPVIQAGCKNCQATNAVSTQVNEPIYEAAPMGESIGSEYEDTDDNPVYIEEGHFGSRTSCGANGCDGGGGCSFSDTYRGRGFCDPCSPWCLLTKRLYIRAESGFFWGSDQQLPVLVTSNNNAIFGGRTIGSDTVNGFRSETGLWFDDCKSNGVLVRTFYGGDNDLSLVTDSSQRANLELPYFSLATNSTGQVLVAVPSQLSGSVNANVSSNAYGGDILLKRMIAKDTLGRWDWLMGYQTARLSESLTLDSSRTTIPPTLPLNTTVSVHDRFQVKNQFHGATFGFSGDVREGNWYFGGLFKLGLGNMERIVDIRGSSTTTVGTGTPNTTDSGFLASSRTNSGRYTNDTFVMTPELGLTAGYRLTRRLDFTIGYNMLRLPKVTRVANALDPRLAVDDSTTPTQLNPQFLFSEFNYTLHSLNLGLQWKY